SRLTTPHLLQGETMSATTNVASPVQSPLTLIMTIKSPEDYQQLKQRLAALESIPIESRPNVVALNKIATVHFARFVFLENNTKLAVTTASDGSCDKYVNAFINHIGWLFDEFLVHMKDAPPLPVAQHRQEFLAYARANDVPVASFYSAYPTLTVLAIRDLAESS